MKHTALEDKLRRILHMEETAAAQLLALLDGEAPQGVSRDTWARTRSILEKIADDTNRHGQMVARMIAAEVGRSRT